MKRLLFILFSVLTFASCTQVVEKEVFVHDTIIRYDTIVRIDTFILDTVKFGLPFVPYDNVKYPLFSRVFIQKEDDRAYGDYYVVTPKGLVYIEFGGRAINPSWYEEDVIDEE